jgi:hypothetical protein
VSLWSTPQSAIQRSLELMRRERMRHANESAQRQAFRQRTALSIAPDVVAHRAQTMQEFAQKGYLGPQAPGHEGHGLGPPQYGEHRGLLPGAIRNLTTPVIGGDPTGLSSPIGALTGLVGLGAAPLAASVGGLIGGTAGAFGGGEAAQRLSLPRPVGELAGGLAGGLGGGFAGSAIAPRLGAAAERAGGYGALAAQESGGTRIPRQAAEQVAEETPISPVSKLTNLIREAKPVRKETELLKGAELRRRAGVVGGIAGQEQGRAGLGAALGSMKGELPRAQFAPVEAGLGKEEIDGLFNSIWSGSKQPFEKVNTATALEGVLTGRLPTRGEIKMLEDTFGPDFASALLSKRTFGQKAWENFVDTLNLPRAVMSSWDASAPLRQAVILTVSRPRQSLAAAGRMFQSLASERVAQGVDEAIANSPYAALKQQSGLYIAPRTSAAATLSSREESFMSSLAHKIPGVRQSERAYITYLNKLRSDTFDAVAKGWEGMDRTPEDYRSLANWLNHTTGRGDLGVLKGSAPILNAAFFSPRLLASRIQIPIDVFTSTPAVRKEIARDLGVSIGTGVTILGLLKASGAADVNLNPQSPDFGKLRMGRQRIDFWGGFQPIARYAATVASGAAEGDKDKVQKTLLKFLRSKLAPVPGLGVDIWEGKTMVGEELSADTTTLKDQAFNRLTPLFLQDLKDSIKNEGIVGGLRATPGLLGVGVQAYGPFVNPKYPPEFKEQLSDQQQMELNDFLDRVRDMRAEWKDKGHDTAKISWEESIDTLAESEKKGPNFIKWANVLHKAAQ